MNYPLPFRFDELELSNRLDALEPRLRVAFAAACAERLAPAYITFSRKIGCPVSEKFAGLLEWLWRDIEFNEEASEEISKNIELCESLTPLESWGSWTVNKAYAEDAAAAMTYAFRCRATAAVSAAAWAARRAYEALDLFIITREQIAITSAEAEERVLLDEIMQAELARQDRDIRDLLGANSTGTPKCISQIRKRANKDAPFFFGLS